MDLPTGAEWTALGLSLQVALLCVLVSAVPGVACGWWLARRDFRGKALVDALVHAPLVLPPVVVGYGLLLLLGRNGPLGGALEALGLRVAFSLPGAVLASAAMGFPLLVRSVQLAVELVDPALEQAAATLGAAPGRVFRTVTLPLAMPGVVTGLLLCFARSLGEFGATITFAGNLAGETRTLPLALYTELQTVGGEAAAARLALVSVTLSFLALLASERIARALARRRRAA